MATLLDLVTAGTLIRHSADLDDDEVPVRFIYRTPYFNERLVQRILPEPCEDDMDTTPSEQVEQTLFDFVIGRPFVYSYHSRKLDPLNRHAWELKTPSVRIFGWFPCKGCFICTDLEMKKCLKRWAQYEPYISGICDYRNSLDLDPPKALTGVRINDVL